ncbi:MAG: MoaD/ThiS family protein [Proteobacteria bacterium]|nr:MoaD/ThiS family protein [Pseudomonadota bacterium]
MKLPFKHQENVGEYWITLEKDYTIENLINLLSLSGKPLIIVVNGFICNDLQKKLEDGDFVSLFPPIAGG